MTAQVKPAEKRERPYPSQALLNALQGGLAGSTASGVAVTPENSLRNTAVLAAVRVLAESVASLPLIVYQREQRGKQRLPDHPLYRLLHDAPNSEMTAFEWRELGMMHLALWGNFYCEIELNGAGRPVALWPLRPDRMQLWRDDADNLWYHYADLDRPLHPSRVFHVRGMGSTGVLGYSLIALARQAVGLGLAAEEFGSRFFGNGAVPGLVLQHPGELGDDAHERLRRSWEDRHGGLEAAQRVAILEEGMTVEKIGIPPEDAQFLATRQFQVNEIARIFRVPLHMLADLERATFSNIEHQSIDFVVHTLRPWLVRWEQAIQRQLVSDPRLFAEFLVDGLLRGDTKSRYESYAIARQWGWLSANDIRELENSNPVEGGDVYLTPLNMADAANGQPTTTPNPTPDATPTRSIERRGGADYERRALARQQLAQTYRATLRDTAQRVVNREVNDISNQVQRVKQGAALAGLGGWLRDFYAEHQQFIARYMQATVTTYAQLVAAQVEDEVGGPRLDPAVTERFATAYNQDRSREWVQGNQARLEAALTDADPVAAIEAQLDAWRSDYADDWAHEETVRLAGAVAVTAYTMLGVQTLRWVNVGETCPHCKSLNGLTIEIHGYFMDADGQTNPGEGVVPLRVGRKMRHPPLHKGCDCMVVAG